MKVHILSELAHVAPNYQTRILTGSVLNQPTSDALWAEINIQIQMLRKYWDVDSIKKCDPVFAMRQLYKRLGKDPNRYRPSSEALMRRILLGKDLYRINTLVDLVNLLSIQSGLCIGAFDLDRIVGTQIDLGVGRSGEPFEAIGRGSLNVEGLPVYRDAFAAIGSPTSDVVRTSIQLETRRLLLVLHSAEGDQGLDEALEDARRLLCTYAGFRAME